MEDEKKLDAPVDEEVKNEAVDETPATTDAELSNPADAEEAPTTDEDAPAEEDDEESEEDAE